MLSLQQLDASNVCVADRRGVCTICVGRHAVPLPPLHGKAARRLRLDRATVPSRTVTDGADCDVLQTTADSVPGIGLGVKITLYFSDVENVASINVSDVVNVEW